ncbi:MAG: glutamine--fructose-6-phosphate transaminase (isomerizing) [Clostridia bacterium]|nr:glutamine--fructose-6-phosphate transaminase (isomerizing) [Clostridia bacterium]
MCGIVGYVGKSVKIKKILARLQNLEYRGYDSSGVAFFGKNLETHKVVGTIDKLFDKIGEKESGLCISHTRWATHGKVSERNAHPQISYNGNFAVVHNGIIENYKSLKEQIGVEKFSSETDTEVLANLLEQESGNTLEKLKSATKKLVGSWALLVVDKCGDAIYASKNKSPLYASETESGYLLASDITCFDKGDYYCFEDGMIAKIQKDKIEFFLNGKMVFPAKFANNSEFGANSKGEFDYFMQKEIKETPKVLKNLCKTYEKLIADSQFLSIFDNAGRVLLCGCGTAYHACALGARWIAKTKNLRTIAGFSSEIRYFGNIEKTDVVILVSQSGETADTLAVLEKAKSVKAKVVAITNCSHSTLARCSDVVLPLCAGAEIAVASTKAYSAMLAVMHILSSENPQEAIKEVEFLADNLVCEIDLSLVKQISFVKRIFFIGRGDDGITASEGALKLKETSYLDSYGYFAGELKHGTIALIEPNVTVVAIVTNKQIESKTLNAVEECLSRGARAVIVSEQKPQIDAKFVQINPKIAENLKSIAAIFPLQWLAASVADYRGCNPDRPRNLAKSVTVE